jgi:hypothetical protein
LTSNCSQFFFSPWPGHKLNAKISKLHSSKHQLSGLDSLYRHHMLLQISAGIGQLFGKSTELKKKWPRLELLSENHFSYCWIERFTIWGYNFAHFHWLKAKSGNDEGSGKQHKLGACLLLARWPLLVAINSWPLITNI